MADFGHNDSLRGSIGARIGTAARDAAAWRMEASLTGRLWSEFRGDNAVAILNPGTPFVVTDTFDGLFGEVGLGVSLAGKAGGWSGFAQSALQFGDGFTAGSARSGLRYQW